MKKFLAWTFETPRFELFGAGIVGYWTHATVDHLFDAAWQAATITALLAAAIAMACTETWRALFHLVGAWNKLDYIVEKKLNEIPITVNEKHVGTCVKRDDGWYIQLLPGGEALAAVHEGPYDSEAHASKAVARALLDGAGLAFAEDDEDEDETEEWKHGS